MVRIDRLLTICNNFLIWMHSKSSRKDLCRLKILVIIRFKSLIHFILTVFVAEELSKKPYFDDFIC